MNGFNKSLLHVPTDVFMYMNLRMADWVPNSEDTA